jgi:hypothetical protein
MLWSVAALIAVASAGAWPHLEGVVNAAMGIKAKMCYLCPGVMRLLLL